MLAEVGRILAAIAALVLTVVGRVWRGMKWLVRNARAGRAEAVTGLGRAGRMLDIAALSAAGDVLVVAELWRRGWPPGWGWAAAVGLVAAVAFGFALRLTPRHASRLVWAGLSVIRIVAVATMALVPPVILVGGGTASTRFLTILALATVVGTSIFDRYAWALTLRALLPQSRWRAFGASTVRYVMLTLPWAVLLALLGLALSGLWSLIAAEAVLFGLVIILLTLPAPPRDVTPALVGQTGLVTPTKVLPQLRASRTTDTRSPEPDGFTVYRPSTLDD